MRHLLAYVYLSGVNDGFLFPGNDNGHISYDQYQSEFQSVCEMLIERLGPFGTHSGRKTAYLFAVWGGGADSDIMLSARHKTVSNAMKYKKDATYLLHLANANDLNFASIISKWRSIFVANVQMGRKVNKNSGRIKSLPEFANFFVTKLCFGDGKSVLSTVEAILEFEKPKSSMDEIVLMCKGHLPNDVMSLLLQKIQQYTTECRLEVMEVRSSAGIAPPTNSLEKITKASPSRPVAVVEMAVAQRSHNATIVSKGNAVQRGGSNDLPGRHKIK